MHILISNTDQVQALGDALRKVDTLTRSFLQDELPNLIWGQHSFQHLQRTWFAHLRIRRQVDCQLSIYISFVGFRACF